MSISPGQTRTRAVVTGDHLDYSTMRVLHAYTRSEIEESVKNKDLTYHLVVAHGGSTVEGD